MIAVMPEHVVDRLHLVAYERVLTMVAHLSEAARELLLEASRDPGGLILKLATLGGSAFLKSNGRTFGDGSPREQAWWDGG